MKQKLKQAIISLIIGIIITISGYSAGLNLYGLISMLIGIGLIYYGAHQLIKKFKKNGNK